MLDNNFQNTTSFIGFVQNGRIFNSYGQPLGYTTDEYNKASLLWLRDKDAPVGKAKRYYYAMK
jgi:hypothetical protein|nr:MAG TPA: hypothetical protein [Caudoviricetes sp.]